MKIYLLVFIATMLVQLIPEKTDKQKIWKIILTFLPLFLFGALRVDFGYDYESYEDDYYSYREFGTDQFGQSEIGYQLLNTLCPSFRFLIVIQSLLVCIAYAVFFYLYIPKDKRILALIMLFLSGQYTVYFMFSGMRNAIAISILIVAIPFIENRKLIYYIALTALASMFHTSALIVFPIVYLIGIKSKMRNREFYIWLIVMALLVIFPLDYLFGDFSQFINLFFDRYTYYLSGMKETGFDRTLLNLSSTSLLGIGLLLFARDSSDERMRMLARLALIGIYANYLGSLNMRLTNYMQYFIIIAWTFLVLQKSLKWRSLYACLVFLYLGYAFFYVFMGSPTFIYDDYISVFNK